MSNKDREDKIDIAREVEIRSKSKPVIREHMHKLTETSNGMDNYIEHLKKPLSKSTILSNNDINTLESDDEHCYKEITEKLNRLVYDKK